MEGAGRACTLVLLLAVALPAAPGWGQAGDEPVLVDGIAAQVGSDIVLVSDVRNLVGPMEARFRAMGATESDLASIRADALERLIERALIRQVVRRSELEASEIEVDSAIAAIAEENDLTMQELVATVEAEGLPYEIYRERIRGEIEQSKVLQGMVASRVRLEESDVRDEYERMYADQPAGGTEVHLRHVLVPFEGDGLDTMRSACREAERAREFLGRGTDFAAVVGELPLVAQGASRDLGWIHMSSLASWMEPHVVPLAPGQISEVISTDFGCNVIQLVGRREFAPKSYDDVKADLYDQMFAAEMQEEYVEFMEKLRDRTYVERKGIYAEAARLGSETLPEEEDGAFSASPGFSPETGFSGSGTN